jgi:acetyl-CoA carboxylase carboxyltransferase component
VGNNGVLNPEAAEKAAHFIQLCNQIDVPLLFLQNVTGFVVGREVEHAGIIKKGSQMINAVTNSTVPHITVILGNSYGAATYAMSGRAFNNRFTFIWPSAKIAVMGGKQIAGVMSMEFDEEVDANIRAGVEAAQDAGSVALEASGAISDDGIIDPRDTRTVLGICLSVVRSKPIKGAEGYGVFRL